MLGPDIDENNPVRKEILAKFWPTASVVLLVYIPVSVFVLHDYAIAVLHFINLILVSTVIPACLKRGMVLSASNFICFIGMITIMPWLITGGPAGSGFWLSITYVIGAFLVSPKRWAIFWLALYAAIAVFIVMLSSKGWFPIAYPLPVLLNMLFIYITTFAFVYLFNMVREYYLELVLKRDEELLKINKTLSSANKELEEFAYIASHDLQEPLRTITNFTQLLEEKQKDNEDATSQKYMRFITTAAERMKHLVADMLLFSRVGKQLAVRSQPLNEIVNEVLQDMALTISESQAKILVADLPVLPVSHTETKLLFQNLISNAIKYRKPGITPQIEIRAQKQASDDWLFWVKDNGIGIEAEFNEKIFVMFQRLHNNADYSGTGIGLSTCKKIVEIYGGSIWVESIPGIGSTFFFTIPQRTGQKSSTAI
jgi:signal transduction histidine kinase